MIAIVDYGMGNLRSVSKAFQSQEFPAVVTRNPEHISNSSGLVLPGVGAFGDCVKNLTEYGLIDPILKFIDSGKPFLGICLGLQVLFEESEEAPGVKGLGVVKGRVVRFPDFKEEHLKVPHMGWNQVSIKKDVPILKGIPENSWFYFVHSFYPSPEDDSVSAVKTTYGFEFTAAVSKNNIFASQFHPEKSSDLGLKMIRNFSIQCGEKLRA
jgi:glutamine amidotransferase